VRRLGLTGRTVLVSVGLLAILGGIFAVTLRAIAGQRDTSTEVRELDQRLQVSAELERRVIDAETGLRGYLITRDARFLQPRNEAVRAIPVLQRRLLVLTSERGDRRIVLRLGALTSDYLQSYQLPELRRAHDDPAAARTVVATGAGKRRVDRIRSVFDRYDARQTAKADAARSASDSWASRAIWITVLGLIAVPLLVGLIAWAVARSVVRPLRRTAAASQRIAAGDLTARVEEGGAGEIEALTGGFNAMAVSLEQGRDELESQNAELESQQEELQRALTELEAEKQRSEDFHGYVASMAEHQDLAALAGVLLGGMTEAAGADAGAVYAAAPGEEEDGAGFELAACSGFDERLLPIAIRTNQGLPGRAVVEGRVRRASHGETGLIVPAFGAEVPVSHELHLPIRSAGRRLGVVSLARTGDPGFSEEQVRLLERMAEPAAVSLANALARQATERVAKVSQSILENTNDAYVAVDAAGVVRAWSDQAEEVFGYSAPEAIGNVLADLILPPDAREAHHERRRKAIAQGVEGRSIGRYRVRIIRKDGTEALVEVSATAVRWGSEWTVAYFSRDVTGHVERERERRAAEAVSRSLAESDQDDDVLPAILRALGSAMDWPLGTYWSWDERAQHLVCELWWNDPEIDLRLLAEVTSGVAVDPAEAPAVLGPALQAWKTGGPAHLVFEDAHLAAAPFRAAYDAGLRGAVALPVRGEDRVLGVMQFGITSSTPPSPGALDALRGVADLIGQVIERRRAEAEAERLKNEFFALVSHELRTPLTSIIGYLDIVREEEAGEVNPEQARYLGVVDRNVRRLLRLVGDLLFVAQVEAGTLSLERGDVDLGTVAEEAVEAARPRADRQGVLLSAQAEPIELAGADRDRLGQLADNLVSNALKFTPEGGRIEVRVRREGDDAVLEVSDTGSGIPPEDVEHLFERFYRSAAATDAAVPGIGLGLSICQAIAEGHAGRITVDSELGRGTTFAVVLPVRQREPAGVMS
jgi:PAS domain S-box-containing protein